ncbi:MULTISPECIES: VOC family protein [unclassified Meiothermus]|uniref:VOC family protein n=1 Tax=unclassified Meiothermus TaxID=370471 RepID=UPI001F1F7B72|nr:MULTISPECIES: VOC family protein [unclassified Meiothermus]
MTVLDHLVVAARTLGEGSAYVEQVLGLPTSPGGKHPKMGTHNRLLNLGGGVYLEVIAIDPQSAPPDRPRWFGLDSQAVRESLEAGPRLIHWVARTDGLEGALARLPELGRIHRMSRDDLSWDITIPDDGSLLEGGLVPTLISWGDTPHPTTRLPEVGCRLVGLRGVHPRPERVAQALWKLDMAEALELHQGEQVGLEAKIQTPGGLRLLR